MLIKTLLMESSILLEVFASQMFLKLVFLISEECGSFLMVCVDISVVRMTQVRLRKAPRPKSP